MAMHRKKPTKAEKALLLDENNQPLVDVSQLSNLPVPVAENIISSHLSQTSQSNPAAALVPARSANAILAADLQAEQDVMAMEARFNDLDHIRNLDQISSQILTAIQEAIAEDPQAFKEAVKKIIKEGKFKSLEQLLSATGIGFDKRENMLSTFDNTRGKTNKRMKLQLHFKGAGGEQVGVQVET
jgi:hypothetical protein